MKAETSRRGNGIDWAAVRAQLAASDAAAAEALSPSPKRARDIMDARARALAEVPSRGATAGEQIDVIRFGLGKERYAIETRYVREVVRFVDFTPVPGTPEFIVGVANLRGQVIAVVDLRRFFNVPITGLSDLSRVLVLGSDGPEFGILADEAQGQSTFAADAVLAPRGQVSQIGRAYLRGVTADAVAVLDGAALLVDEQLFVNQA